MTDQPTNHKRNVWEQWEWVWHLSAYAFLTFNLIRVMGNSQPVEQPAVFLGLSALLAIWYTPFVATPIAEWGGHLGRRILYLFFGWALWGGLVSLNATSLMLIGMFVPLIFTRFPIRWALAIVTVQMVGIYSLYAFLYQVENRSSLLLIVLGLVIIANLIGYFISALVEQSLERQRLLDELIEARTNLLRAERESGVLAERQRLARDIHDTLAQKFTSLIMHLAAARLGDPAAVLPQLEVAEQIARDGLNESRHIIWDMRPELLEQGSLVKSIEQLAARWSAENGINVNTAVTGEPHSLPPETEAALLRISQEALHNIKKHAQAKNVKVTFSYMPDQLALDITDDGVGFESLKISRGFGMQTMRERAEELGGTLAVESEAGKGAAIAVSLPITEPTLENE